MRICGPYPSRCSAVMTARSALTLASLIVGSAIIPANIFMLSSSPCPLALGRSKIGRHTSELQSLMRISYAVFCLKKKKRTMNNITQPDKSQTIEKTKQQTQLITQRQQISQQTKIHKDQT